MNPMLDDYVNGQTVYALVKQLAMITVYSSKKRVELSEETEPYTIALKELSLQYLIKAEGMVD